MWEKNEAYGNYWDFKIPNMIIGYLSLKAAQYEFKFQINLKLSCTQKMEKITFLLGDMSKVNKITKGR